MDRRLTTAASLLAVVAAVAAGALGGCGSGDDADAESGTSAGTAPLGPNPTPSNPGPNPSTSDPGPNPTDDGPVTVQGAVAIDVDAGCITLETEAGRLDVRFDGYDAAEVADGPAVVDDTGTPVARDGDSMIVAGYPAPAGTADSPCGAPFDVESLVNVTPAL